MVPLSGAHAALRPAETGPNGARRATTSIRLWRANISQLHQSRILYEWAFQSLYRKQRLSDDDPRLLPGPT
jgi:hypothetical protein